MIFDKYADGARENSVAIYGREWNYEVIPSVVVKFDEEDRFDLRYVLGDKATRYDNQAEAIRFEYSDQVKITEYINRLPHLERKIET